jgi:hypothetical protein
MYGDHLSQLVATVTVRLRQQLALIQSMSLVSISGSTAMILAEVLDNVSSVAIENHFQDHLLSQNVKAELTTLI